MQARIEEMTDADRIDLLVKNGEKHPSLLMLLIDQEAHQGVFILYLVEKLQAGVPASCAGTCRHANTDIEDLLWQAAQPVPVRYFNKYVIL